MKNDALAPWHFEGFRRFLTYGSLQQAAAVLEMVEGAEVNDRVGMSKLAGDLRLRTGLEWIPVRESMSSITWLVEGNVFRNKKRVLTSTFILDIAAYEEGEIRLTNFGRSLARGHIDSNRCYQEIIRRYQFPHPAYEENWLWWSNAGKSLKPLCYLLELLLIISEVRQSFEPVTIAEIAAHGGRTPEEALIGEIAKNIVRDGSATTTKHHDRTDDFDRKLADMLGFLSIAGYVAKSGKGYILNPIRTNPETGELVFTPINRMRTMIQGIIS